MFNDKIKKKDAVAFFRFSVIFPMLNAPKGQIDATAKKLAKTEFNDIVNQKMDLSLPNYLYLLHELQKAWF